MWRSAVRPLRHALRPLPCGRVSQAISATRSYTWGTAASGAESLRLWPPPRRTEQPQAQRQPVDSDDSTAHMLHTYTNGMRSLRRSVAQPRYRGAVLLLHGDRGADAPEEGHDPPDRETSDLDSAVRSLSSLLHMPLYGLASDSLRQLHDATLMQPAPVEHADAADSAAPAEPAVQPSLGSTLAELDESQSPQFLLIVSHAGIRAVQLQLQGQQRGSGTGVPSLIPGGSVQVDLFEYKRVGSHGLDAFSPLLRACVTDMAAATAATTPVPASSPSRDGSVLVLDATMGAGRDSLMLASCGARVAMVEQDAVFALLMCDGLRRAAAAERQRPGPLAPLLPRLTLHFGDARAYMRSLQSEPASAQPDCVYADPFYPDAPPSALSKSDRPRNEKGSGGKSKKHMELLRLLWTQTRAQADSEVEPVPDARFFATPSNRALRSLLLAALALPSHPRVVLKHPAAPFARRLLRDMDFHVERSYDSRDTAYHVMVRAAEPLAAADADADDSGATAAALVSPPGSKSKQGRPTKGKHVPRTSGGRSNKHKAGSSGVAARSFHSAALHAQAASSTDAVAAARPPPAATTGSSSGSSAPPLPSYTFHALGHIRSCFPDRFSIPRQGCLASSARAVLTLDPAQMGALNHMLPERSWNKSVEGLDKFSHLWIVFAFHDNMHKEAGTAAANERSAADMAGSDDTAAAAATATSTDSVARSPPSLLWRQTARPPRLGGKEQVGVFASRSPYRPNGIGMSAVRLERVVLEPQPLSTTGTPAEGCGPRVHLHLSGVDLLDGTPVLDIKPVIPYCDVPRPPVRLGWAEDAVARYDVELHPEVEVAVARAQTQLDERAQGDPSVPHVHLRSLLIDLLSLDPRHGHQQSSHPVTAPHSLGRSYGFRILDWNARYSIVRPGVFHVDSITSMEEFRASQRDKKKKQPAPAATPLATPS